MAKIVLPEHGRSLKALQFQGIAKSRTWLSTHTSVRFMPGKLNGVYLLLIAVPVCGIKGLQVLGLWLISHVLRTQEWEVASSATDLLPATFCRWSKPFQSALAVVPVATLSYLTHQLYSHITPHSKLPQTFVVSCFMFFHFAIYQFCCLRIFTHYGGHWNSMTTSRQLDITVDSTGLSFSLNFNAVVVD